MDDAGKILWVEDNPNDIEPLTEARLAGERVVGRDGEGALDYLCHRGPYEARLPIHHGATILQGTEPDLRAISGAMLASSREETLGE
jgi:hypothetical protein